MPRVVPDGPHRGTEHAFDVAPQHLAAQLHRLPLRPAAVDHKPLGQHLGQTRLYIGNFGSPNSSLYMSL